MSKDGIGLIENDQQNEDSLTDGDMDEAIKMSSLERKARNVMHRVNKDWNNKITAVITKEVKQAEEEKPKSSAAKKR